MSSKGRRRAGKQHSNRECKKCKKTIQDEVAECVKCEGVFHPSCESVRAGECGECSGSRKRVIQETDSEEEDYGSRIETKKERKSMIEEGDASCDECGESFCGCKNGKGGKKRTTRSRSRSKSRTRTALVELEETSMSEVEEDTSEEEDEAEEVINKISLMEDPTDTIHLLWTSEDEEEEKTQQSQQQQQQQQQQQKKQTQPIVPSETKATAKPMESAFAKATSTPGGKSILSGMSREKLISQLTNLPLNVLATLGVAARREMLLKKPHLIAKGMMNRQLTRQESIQLITDLLTAQNSKTPVPAVKKRKPMPRTNVTTGTLPRGTKLVTPANELDLRLSIEKALMSSEEEDIEDEEEEEPPKLSVDVHEVIREDVTEGSFVVTPIDPMLEQFDKIPIGAFRRSRRLSKPFLVLSSAIKSSVLHQTVASKQPTGSSIHSVLTPTLSNFPASPLIAPVSSSSKPTENPSTSPFPFETIFDNDVSTLSLAPSFLHNNDGF